MYRVTTFAIIHISIIIPIITKQNMTHVDVIVVRTMLKRLETETARGSQVIECQFKVIQIQQKTVLKICAVQGMFL